MACQAVLVMLNSFLLKRLPAVFYFFPYHERKWYSFKKFLLQYTYEIDICNTGVGYFIKEILRLDTTKFHFKTFIIDDSLMENIISKCKPYLDNSLASFNIDFVKVVWLASTKRLVTQKQKSSDLEISFQWGTSSQEYLQVKLWYCSELDIIFEMEQCEYYRNMGTFP